MRWLFAVLKQQKKTTIQLKLRAILRSRTNLRWQPHRTSDISTVSSRANLLISVKCLWVTLSPLVTMPGQCPLTNLLKEKTIRIKDKRHEWAWKHLHPWQGATHPLQRHPQVSHTFPCYQCTHFPDIPYHLIHSHGMDFTSPRNIPHLISISSIGRHNVPSKLVL